MKSVNNLCISCVRMPHAVPGCSMRAWPEFEPRNTSERKKISGGMEKKLYKMNGQMFVFQPFDAR